MPQDSRAHHRRERQGDHGRNDDRDGKRHGKLAEQAPHHVAHEQQRNQHGDQRHGQRENGEADLLRALERRFHGRIARFDVARDVLDHHDGIVHHEAGGDGQRHQRQVIQAVAQDVHRRESADQRQRHSHAGDDGGVETSQEQEDDQHDQPDRQHQFELDVGNRCFDGGGQIGKRGHLNARGQVGLQLRHQLLDALDHADGVGAGLALHVQDHRRSLIHPRGLIIVLHAIHDVRHVGQHHRRAVAVGHHNVPVVVAGDQLIVGVDLVILARPIEVPFGGVHAGLRQRRAQVFQVDAVGGQRRRVGLNAHRGLLAAADGYQADAVELRNLRRKARVHQVLDLGKRHGIRGDGQGEHRGIGGIGLAVDRRRGQDGGQQTLRRVDGGLHLFLGDIDSQA